MVDNSAQSKGSRQIVYVKRRTKAAWHQFSWHQLGSSRTVRGLWPQFVKILLTEKESQIRDELGGGALTLLPNQ